MSNDTPPKQPDDATVVLGSGGDATVIVNESDRQSTGGGIPTPPASGSKALRVLNERFELTELLGRGAMGHVYKAIDRRKVEANDKDPYVAIKLLTEEFQKHPDAFVTLQREARKAQNLSSDHIVKVFDFDRDGDTIYMTMEYLDGIPLDELIAKHTENGLDRAAAWKLLNGMCEGLSVAHRARIVHSDMKPGNIFVTADGDAKLLDFGIARAVIDTGSDGTTGDFDAGSLGALTPAYASLEMFAGAHPDPRDDIYALGCIAYEILSGKHPYERATAEQAAKLGVSPKRIPGISNTQWKALKGALALERDNRVASVEEFDVQFIPGKRRRGSLLGTSIAAIVSAAIVGAIVYAVLPDGGEVAARAQKDVDSAYSQAIARATTCRDKKDYVCAKDNVDIALKLHTDSDEAKSLAADIFRLDKESRNKQISAYLTEADGCSSTGDFECASAALDNALALQNNHPGALERKPAIDAGLLAGQEKAAAVAALEAEVLACQSSATERCLAEKLQALIAMDPDNALAADISAQLDDQQRAKAEAAAKARQAKLEQHLNAAQNCFNNNQLSCADREIKASLAIDGDNLTARALNMSVQRARAKAAEDRKRVNLFLSEAQQCFDQKRYNCTIAKTDSALSIDPSSAAAKQLQSDAEAAQAAAKKRIKIE